MCWMIGEFVVFVASGALWGVLGWWVGESTGEVIGRDVERRKWIEREVDKQLPPPYRAPGEQTDKEPEEPLYDFSNILAVETPCRKCGCTDDAVDVQHEPAKSCKPERLRIKCARCKATWYERPKS